jgi:DNA repair exonuclease SbcCD nuclease subunit
MMRILHVADVHLGASHGSFGALADERAASVRAAFRDLPRVAGEAGAHAVLMAGDLFDTPRPDDDIAAEARETVRRLLEIVPAVFAIPGNHDPLVYPGSPYGSLPAEAHVFTEPAFGEPASVETEVGPLHVYGLAYDFAHNPDPLAGFDRADLPGVHVVLLHGAVRDAPHWSRGESLRLERSELERLNVDYIALGDYHRYRPPEEFSPDGTLPACYAGSFAALDYTESGPHGVVLAEVESGTVRTTLLPSDVPVVQDLGDVDISVCADDVQAADRVAEAVHTGSLPVVTLTGQTEYAVDPARVESELAARFSFARVRDRTRYYDSARLGDLADRDDVVGHVARLGLKRIRGAADEDEVRLRERALRKALRSLGVT